MTTEPTASRPHMPAYGISTSHEGLLPWSWAEERLTASRNYWIGTVSPDGRPHSTPVWGVWHDRRFYFGMDPNSFKARNLARNQNIVVTTEDGAEAVILEGVFEGQPDESMQSPVRKLYATKYDFDTAGSLLFVVRPLLALGFIEAAEKFSTAATRWRFA